MRLEEYIRLRREEKGILLMTHLVLGYPSFAANRDIIDQMVTAGVDCIEMQIPFSEPVADGPVILRANQNSLADGTRVADCIAFAEEITATYDIPFLFMTYYNIIFKYGEQRFLERTAQIGIQGAIIPDLPPEEGADFHTLAKKKNIAPIQIFAPTSTDSRMRLLQDSGAGFIYCVARRGVTGASTDFDPGLERYLQRCRQATPLPLAVGFGISNKADVDFLKGRADIAVIGTKTIQLMESDGASAVGPFLAGLR